MFCCVARQEARSDAPAPFVLLLPPKTKVSAGQRVRNIIDSTVDLRYLVTGFRCPPTQVLPRILPVAVPVVVRIRLN